MSIIKAVPAVLALSLSGACLAHVLPGFQDPSFGGGDVVVPIGGTINWVGVQSSGKVIAVGSSGGTSAIRFNLDGTLDSTFQTSGALPVDPYCYGLVGVSAAIDSSNRIVMIDS